MSLRAGPATIFVADDDEAMRSLLGSTLRRRGFEVCECSDGQEVLDRIESVEDGGPAPDLVVSDLRMPGLTGLDVLHRLKQRLPEVPVIIITAFGDPQTHRRAKALGATLVIDKPFELGEFLEQVSATLSTNPTDASS